MTAVLERYQLTCEERRREADRSHQRLDIQGLRAVAILTVLANHLWGWPGGGFVGVDVFFVISGFLITGNLLRTAESAGTVSFRRFYWNRVRRIVPAATVVLILTFLVSTLLYLPFRAQQVGVDALFASVFLANWHFAMQDTDYFAAGDAVSPLQHYWSLSIEEQFYFVWPALILLISVVVVRRGWGHARRMELAAAVMAVIVTVSLALAVIETAASPTWAYFSTFDRVWELGVGALLATSVGLLARIPRWLKPWMSWAGLLLIGISLVVIGESSVGFPAPWALLPVAGSALVIAAGVGGEPRYQEFLRNPVSTYIGNFSYSLYLVHWPVIVLLGAVMAPGASFYLVAITLAFGLAIASYHFVENPLRHADLTTATAALRAIRSRDVEIGRPSKYAAVGAMALLTLGLCLYITRPVGPPAAVPSAAAAVATDLSSQSGAPLPPLTAALQKEIGAALEATEWPALHPTMESVIAEHLTQIPEASGCGLPAARDTKPCSWGSATAPMRVVLVGNSVATGYIGPLRDLALASDGRVQVHTEAMPGCNFVDDLIDTGDQRYHDACSARKQHAVDLINQTRPAVVVISNTYATKAIAGREMSAQEWGDSMRRLVDTFRGSVQHVVFLAPPPGALNIGECYGVRSSRPSDCISSVDAVWTAMAETEQALAASIGGSWIDSRPWFCSTAGYCPSFVGSTPTKFDAAHLVPAYGEKISPVIGESFRQAGVF